MLNKFLYLLAADIGGTHSRFGLFKLAQKQTKTLKKSPVAECLEEVWLPTQKANSLTELLHQAKRALINPARPTMLSLAVPAPVYDEICHAPNIPWPLSAEEALYSEAFSGAGARLVNDFVAQGYACLLPHILNLQAVLPGQPIENKPIALIGAGTGLGKATVLKGEKLSDFRVLPSEGGHAVFPFIGPAEQAFAAFFQQKLGVNELVGDNVLSGTGLEGLFLYHTGKALPASEISPLLPQHPMVMEWLARFYGRSCRNFALDTLALGGVYVTGGLASYVPGLLQHKTFAESFRHSHTQGDLLARIPVHHIGNRSSGLWGAAIYGALSFYNYAHSSR